MSELTSCNYCILQRIKARAKENSDTVHVLGQDVYVVPKNEKFIKSDPWSKKTSKHHVAWFMELTNYCCC